MNGVRIVTSEFFSDQVIDTSGCRSPSRALRRLKRGIRGRVKVSRVPWKHALRLPDGSFGMHPKTFAEVERHINGFSDYWRKPL